MAVHHLSCRIENTDKFIECTTFTAVQRGGALAYVKVNGRALPGVVKRDEHGELLFVPNLRTKKLSMKEFQKLNLENRNEDHKMQRRRI